MITNFEEITRPLTLDEKTVLIKIANLLEFRTAKNPIKAPDLVMLIRRETFLKKQFNQARLRKMVNWIRGNGVLPIIATSKGYYLSYDSNEVKREIKSLNERAEAIRFASNGLKKYLTKAEQLILVLEND